ncbi:MAG: ThuA domain-containing protein [Candidatus Binatia bacterium]|nr:ThuA domain-containing protein [Candidatus Binatia bacterium]
MALGALTLFGACAEDPLPAGAPEVLLFSQTKEFRHESIEHGTEVLVDEARGRGIRLVPTEEAAVFTDDGLAKFEAVIFFNTTGDVLNDRQQLAFERYVQSGGGFVGIHSAADTERRGNVWPWYTRLVGAAFLSHPEDNVQQARLRVREGSHSATSHLAETWDRTDEWYDYERFNPNVNVLLAVDESTYEGGVTGSDHPIAWYHAFDGGRSFYTGLGHTEESFDEDAFLSHVFGGLAWVMEDGRRTPLDPDHVRPEPWRLVPEVLAESIGEPVVMAFTPGGELWVVERNGGIRRFDPASGELGRVAKLDVYAVSENGLGGIAFDPNYEENRWVYLYYAADGDPNPENRLSRFSTTALGIDLASEKQVLSFPIDRGMTSHEGGSLQFDGEGNLWISTGDDTNPHSSEGYSPHDDRPDRTIYDARRSAANTQDLRGKILRIRPEADGTYSVPPGNLFGDSGEGRPEIYAMGLRNPYRAFFDATTSTLYWGEVGPDAKDDSPSRGPQGHDEINRATAPGNFGWPFVIGPGRSYAAYDFEAEEPGEFFAADRLRNTSVRNTGSEDLPPAEPAWISYTRDSAGSLFDLESGSAEVGRTALVGPVYRSSDHPESAEKLPGYFDGKLFVFEFMRDWIKLVSMDDDGTIRKIEPFADELDLVAPIDLKVAPDGTVYVLEYGSTWFNENHDSRLTRISFFSGENPLPKAVAHVSPTVGGAPLEVELIGHDSFDRNPDDELRYRWIVTSSDGTSRTVAETADADVRLDAGTYLVELEVTDKGGGVSTAEAAVYAGNAPPQVTVDFVGGSSFFFPEEDAAPYEVRVTDVEDGSTPDAIRPEDVQVRVAYVRSTGGVSGAEPMSRTVLGRLDPALDAIEDNGCFSCHNAERESAGPSFAEIANRYEGNREKIRPLAQKIIEGGSGVWGERAMPAQSHVDEETAVRMMDYILTGGSGGVRRPLSGTVPLDQHQAESFDGDWTGHLVPGAYVLTATYTDRGGQGIGPITQRETRLLRPSRSLAANADALVGVSTLEPTMPDSIARLLPGGVPEFPQWYRVVVPQGRPAYLGLDAVDLTGIDSLAVEGMAPSLLFDGGQLEVRLGSPEGQLVDTLEFDTTLLMSLTTEHADLSAVTGVQDLYLVVRRADETASVPFVLTTLEFSANR